MNKKGFSAKKILRGVSRLTKSPAMQEWLENSRRPGLWVTAMVLCFATVFTALTLLLPKKDFSEKENRKLAQFPAVSWAGLADGSAARDTESFFADQFTGRDFWIQMNLRFRRLLGQKENGGVYIGKKKTLFLIPSRPNEAALNKNLLAMEAFASANPDVKTYVAIIPNAVTVLKDKLPAFAPVPDQAAQMQTVAEGVPSATFLDVTEALLAHKDEYVFYRTDHHWTSLGARYAFEEMAAKMEITPAEDYDVYPVSTTFSGTLASKSGRFKTLDTVDIYVPHTETEYNVTYLDTQEKAPSMYKKEALDAKDHYTVFFGGNYGRVDINTTAGTGRRLLLFKDSYANCMIQFLYPCFDEIVMVDPRYYYDSAAPLITQHGVTDVLYLYNCDTFMTDTSLADALAAPAANPADAPGLPAPDAEAASPADAEAETKAADNAVAGNADSAGKADD